MKIDKKKTLLLFDIDGTLLNPRTHTIENSTQQVLKDLKAQGYMMLLCTGRSKISSESTGVFNIIPWDGYVLNNGHVVLDKDFSRLFTQFIEPEKIKAIIEKAKQKDIGLLGQGDRWYLFHYTPLVSEIHKQLGSIYIPEVVEYKDQEISTFMVYGHDYSIFKDYPELEAIPGMQDYADVVIKGLSKATGVQAYIDKYPVDRVISFGDSLNDISTFEMADDSVAMYQCAKELFDIATIHISEPDNEILQGVMQLELLKED